MKKSVKPNPPKTIFQQRLVELRKQKKFSQEQLSEILNVGRDTVIAWENGIIKDKENREDIFPSVNNLVALSDVLGKSTDWLLGRSDFTQDGNEYISSVTGLSDKAINQLRKLVQHDTFLKQSNKKNKQRNDNLSVRPVHLALRIPVINFILESKSFINLINDFIYYLNSDKYTKLLDGSFHELPTKEIIPADNDLIAGGVMLEIDSDTNKALAKNLLDIRLEKLSQEYKNK
jgi:transcriptional regulator with XRE-family HTH domain